MFEGLGLKMSGRGSILFAVLTVYRGMSTA